MEILKCYFVKIMMKSLDITLKNMISIEIYLRKIMYKFYSFET
jgi:hypothetical protein